MPDDHLTARIRWCWDVGQNSDLLFEDFIGRLFSSPSHLKVGFNFESDLRGKPTFGTGGTRAFSLTLWIGHLSRSILSAAPHIPGESRFPEDHVVLGRAFKSGLLVTLVYLGADTCAYFAFLAAQRHQRYIERMCWWQQFVDDYNKLSRQAAEQGKCRSIAAFRWHSSGSI